MSSVIEPYRRMTFWQIPSFAYDSSDDDASCFVKSLGRVWPEFMLLRGSHERFELWWRRSCKLLRRRMSEGSFCSSKLVGSTCLFFQSASLARLKLSNFQSEEIEDLSPHICYPFNLTPALLEKKLEIRIWERGNMEHLLEPQAYS